MHQQTLNTFRWSGLPTSTTASRFFVFASPFPLVVPLSLARNILPPRVFFGAVVRRGEGVRPSFGPPENLNLSPGCLPHGLLQSVRAQVSGLGGVDSKLPSSVWSRFQLEPRDLFQRDDLGLWVA